MRVPVWLWDEFPSVADVQAKPISAIYVKVLDGATWQRAFDSDAPASANDFRDRYVTPFRNANIDVVPWVNARGSSPATEGALAGQCAAMAGGRCIVDLEDGPQFWVGNAAAVSGWVAAFQAAGGTEIWLCPDSREPHMGGINFSEWWSPPLATRVMPQSYWTDFQHSWLQGLEETTTPLTSRGVAANRIYPVLPGNATAADIRTAVLWCAQGNDGRNGTDGSFSGVSVWRLATTAQSVWDAIAATSDPWFPEATPAPAPQPPTQSEEDRLRAALQDIRDRASAALGGGS